MIINESYIWLNGALLPAGEARVSPYDHGFTVGDGAFETLRVYNGVPFAVKRHWQRLCHSCEFLGIQPPSEKVFSNAMTDVLQANPGPPTRLRFTISSGVGPLGSGKGDASPTLSVLSSSSPEYGPTVTLVTVPWTRNERGALTGLKSTSYAENVIALKHAQSRGADEAIFANTQGDLCEGTGTNIFIVKDGICSTPPLSSGCLAGVTRALVLELAERHGVLVREERLPLASLLKADEAFLTSSTREVHPVSQVDGHPLPESPGPVSLHLAALFKKLVLEDLDP
jgi:branched-chain amino acid aminotransferase